VLLTHDARGGVGVQLEEGGRVREGEMKNKEKDGLL